MTAQDAQTLANRLGIATRDPANLLAELRARRADIHPDANGGVFKSQADETLWHELNAAIASLTEIPRQPNALVPVDELAKQLALIADKTRPSLEDRNAATMSTARERLSRQLYLPRIGSGVFATLCAGLFTFGGNLVEHPILGPIARTDGFYMFWGTLLAYSTFFFLFTWYAEQRAAARLEFWSSDKGLRQLAARLGGMPTDESTTMSSSFRMSQVVDTVQGPRPRLFPFSLGGVDRQSAAAIADVQVARMAEAGVIERMPGPTLDPGFRFLAPAI